MALIFFLFHVVPSCVFSLCPSLAKKQDKPCLLSVSFALDLHTTFPDGQDVAGREHVLRGISFDQQKIR